MFSPPGAGGCDGVHDLPFQVSASANWLPAPLSKKPTATQCVADTQEMRPRAPPVAPAGSFTAIVRHAVPFHFSASGPPIPLNAFWSMPTARQFLAVWQDTSRSSWAVGGGAAAFAGAAAAAVAEAAVTQSTVASVTSADAIVLWRNSSPRVQLFTRP